MNYTHLALSLLMHVLVLFVALCVIYFVVISKAQQRVLESQIKENVENIVHDNFPTDAKTKVTMYTLSPVTSYLADYYNIDTEATVINNKRVINLITTVGVALFLLILVPYLVLRFSCNKKIDMRGIILENVIFFTCIACFEIYFFKNVVLQYIPVQPSVFKQAFMDDVVKYFAA